MKCYSNIKLDTDEEVKSAAEAFVQTDDVDDLLSGGSKEEKFEAPAEEEIIGFDEEDAETPVETE